MRDYSRSELTTAIDEWILNERDRAILKRRLIDGICFLLRTFSRRIRYVCTPNKADSLQVSGDTFPSPMRHLKRHSDDIVRVLF